MAYRDRLEPASFRGVPFFVEASLGGKGRRVAVTRLAGQDGSRQQDLGRQPDQFDVEAFVASDDYDIERNALEDALLEPGPGPLVLPSRGEIQVRVIAGPATSERRTELGFCSIRFTVVVEGKEKTRRAAPSTPSLLSKLAAALRAAANVDFTDTFSVLAMPGKYITSATLVVANIAQNLRGIQGKINGTLNPIQDLTAAIDSLNESASTLINTPAVLASTLGGLVDSIFGLADVQADALDRTTGLSVLASLPYGRTETVRSTRLVAKDLFGFGGAEVARTGTANGTRDAQNRRALYRVTRANAIARQMDTYATAPFDSSTLALSVLADLTAELDALRAYSAGDALFGSLADARGALVRHLTQTASELPAAVTYAPPQQVPALLLAHSLYGDARLDAEIVARNRPRYPLFLGGKGQTLEVVLP